MNKRSLLSAAIACALIGPTYAQDVSTFSEVTVTANRASQTLESTSASVAVVTDEQLEENLVTSLSSVFDYTPGVTFNSSARQGEQTINIRGMEGKRVKIIVDGASQPGDFGSGRLGFINSSAITVDPDMLKSVEVVKGAASSLHGSNAIGGVVAFETKSPADFLTTDDTFAGHTKLTYSSRDKSFSEHVALANRFGDLETLVAFTRRDGEEIQNFTERSDLENYAVESQDSSANNLLVKLQYQINDGHRVELLAELIKDEDDSIIYHSSYEPFIGQDTTEQNRFAIKHIWLSDALFADVVTSRLSYLQKDENGVTKRFQAGGPSRRPGGLPTKDNWQTKDYIYTEDILEFDSQLDKELNSHSLVYGITLTSSDITNINQEYNSDAATDDKLFIYTPHAKEHSLGLFFQDEIRLAGGQLTLTPGIRYDYFKTDPGDNLAEEFEVFSDSAFTSRIGANYKLSDNHTLFGQVSQGFRAPTFNELYFTYDNPTWKYYNLPSPGLKSEESITYELGLRHSTDSTYTEVSGFYSDYKNFIETRKINVIGEGRDARSFYSRVNIGKAEVQGLELSNQVDWHKLISAPQGITSNFVIAYTEGKDGNNNPLNSINPWNAVAGLNYDSPNGQWGSSIKFNYTSNKSKGDVNTDKENGGTADQVELPSASVVDITAYYKPFKDVTVRGGIFNVGNREYYRWNDVRGDKELNREDSQASRNFSLSIKYDF